MKTTEGKLITAAVAASTKYVNADGSAAQRSDLTVGRRVVAKISTDGKTATSVKLAKK